MTYHDANQPKCKASTGAIALTIQPKIKDLGEFSVRRVLPSSDRQMIGSFIFFDHMGPAKFPPGKGISVRPHPHIGLATITYLFDGQIMHRDSLGFKQPIEAGAVNLMTAGRGIVHSERAGDDLDQISTLHGIQSWMALPETYEEIDPNFVHYPSDTIPEVDVNGVTVRIIMGEAYGTQSSVTQYSPTLYLECLLNGEDQLDLPDTYEELAFYVVEGAVAVGETIYQEGTMAVVCPDQPICVRAKSPSRMMVIGGTSLGPRHIHWNFVSSSRERIDQARSDWRAQRFDRVPGDDEFIPLPE